jgi:hypothetical protein
MFKKKTKFQNIFSRVVWKKSCKAGLLLFQFFIWQFLIYFQKINVTKRQFDSLGTKLEFLNADNGKKFWINQLLFELQIV